MGSIIALPEVIFLISATWNSYGYYGLKEIEGAKWIQENTSPNARFLTSNNPNQFIPMLTVGLYILGILDGFGHREKVI